MGTVWGLAWADAGPVAVSPAVVTDAPTIRLLVAWREDEAVGPAVDFRGADA